MRGSLYCATVSEFIKALDHDSIPDQIMINFRVVNGYSPAESEVISWRKSWPALGKILEQANVPEAGILLEYRLPLSSARVDCVIAGSDSNGHSHTLLVELKQWSMGKLSDTPDCVDVYGQDVLHPSAQVLAYGDYIRHCHSVFVSGQTSLY